MGYIFDLWHSIMGRCSGGDSDVHRILVGWETLSRTLCLWL